MVKRLPRSRQAFPRFAACLLLISILAGCEREIERVYVPVTPTRLAWKLERPLPLGTSYYLGIYGNSPTSIYAVGAGGSIAHFDGTLWKSMNAGGFKSSIAGVWAASESDAFAFGDRAILHYDGIRWSTMRIFDESIDAIWGFNGSDVWALGYSSAYHYDGSNWTKVELPTDVGNSHVWGSAPDDIYAVGGQNVILRYDGAGWSKIDSLPTTRTWFTAVWGSGANDVWVVGNSDTLIHFDGSRWTAVIPTDPNMSYLIAVSGTGPNDVYFAGTRDVWHYDGSTFTDITDHNIVGRIEGMWATSGKLFRVGAGAPIRTYDGSKWGDVQGGPFPNLYGVWTDAPDNAWAVGNEGTILHYNGTIWSDESNPEITQRGLWAIAGTRNNLYSVGSKGTILRYDGSTWRDISGGPAAGQYLYAVWAAGDEAFTVGSGGTIVHVKGASASLMESHTSRLLLAVWGSSGDDVFAVGPNGTVVHYDGTQWTPLMFPDSTAYFDCVWGTGRNDIYVGEVGGDFIYRFNGSTWSIMFLAPTYGFGDIWGTSASNIYGLSGNNTISHYDGSQWTEEQLYNVWSRIYAIRGSGSNNIFAVGEGGLIVHYGR